MTDSTASHQSLPGAFHGAWPYFWRPRSRDFPTDEFGGANVALVHAAFRGPRIVPTPRLVVDYARNGYLSDEQARALVGTMGSRRSWAGSPYVDRLLDRLG